MGKIGQIFLLLTSKDFSLTFQVFAKNLENKELQVYS